MYLKEQKFIWYIYFMVCKKYWRNFRFWNKTIKEGEMIEKQW